MKIKLKEAARIGAAAKGNVRVEPAGAEVDVSKDVAEALLARGRAEKIGVAGSKPANGNGGDGESEPGDPGQGGDQAPPANGGGA